MLHLNATAFIFMLYNAKSIKAYYSVNLLDTNTIYNYNVDKITSIKNIALLFQCILHHLTLNLKKQIWMIFVIILV